MQLYASNPANELTTYKIILYWLHSFAFPKYSISDNWPQDLSPTLSIPHWVPCAGICGVWEPYKERIESFESCFFPISSDLLPGSGKRFRFSGTEPALPAVGIEPTTWQENVPCLFPMVEGGRKQGIQHSP